MKAEISAEGVLKCEVIEKCKDHWKCRVSFCDAPEKVSKGDKTTTQDLRDQALRILRRQELDAIKGMFDKAWGSVEHDELEKPFLGNSFCEAPEEGSQGGKKYTQSEMDEALKNTADKWEVVAGDMEARFQKAMDMVFALQAENAKLKK